MGTNQEKLSEDLNGWGWLLLAIAVIGLLCIVAATVYESYFVG
jgi:hypothetical protein